MEINEYLPSGWKVSPIATGLAIYATDPELAQEFYVGARTLLERSAQNMQSVIQIMWDGCEQPLKTGCSKNIKAIAEPDRPTPSHPTDQASDSIGSYTPSRISPDAGYEAIMDFIRGWRSQGLIVTVTSMKSAKCLLANDLQVMDRNPPSGSKWTIENWTGLNFLQLWHDSFMPGRRNYYGELVERIERDRFISGYEYDIRRPSGSLGRYSSDYHYVENFGGVPVRIAISKVGDWQIVEDAHLEVTA